MDDCQIKKSANYCYLFNINLNKFMAVFSMQLEITGKHIQQRTIYSLEKLHVANIVVKIAPYKQTTKYLRH